MEYKKSFFGRTVIDSSDSEELNDNEKIELEYYETRNLAEKEERKYGIEVVKKKDKDEKFNIESKVINNISSEEKVINRLLEILMINKVTPITVDDIIDVMEEEATEDMYKFAGTSEQERDIVQNINKTPIEQIFSSVRARIPWLIITLLAGLLSSAILSNLDFIMNPKYASLVFFIPIVLGMGGNIGTQSSALAVMSLYNKDIDFNNVIREAVVGVITGIICSLIVSIIVFLFIKDVNIVLVVTVSLFINMIVGAVIGGFMPILFKKLDVDPSIISAPVIATVLDITGIAIYLITTTIILSKIV